MPNLDTGARSTTHLIPIKSIRSLTGTIPSKRALTTAALLAVLSALERQRAQSIRNNPSGEDSSFSQQEDMSGELQTIPARHGVATFVPKGRTLKVINTYGKQTVSFWAFALGESPEEAHANTEDEKLDQKDEGELQDELKNKAETLQKEIEKEKQNPPRKDSLTADDKERLEKKSKDSDDDPPGEDPDSVAARPSDDPPEEAPNASSTSKPTDSKGQKKTWSSYLPSMPYRKNQAQETKTGSEDGKTADKSKPKDAEQTSNQTSKRWSSYLPTGSGISTYLPDVKIPDSKGVISAFKASHYRDPNKSYAEQLYDFSKTPVGAGSLAAATGSGAASSLYAAYTAYSRGHSSSTRSSPPMEFLSLSHTISTHQSLSLPLQKPLLTNLRAPILTLIEDTTPEAHDLITPACDANLYKSLNVPEAEEHGSCAENLVIALRELNERVGLSGEKAVGRDVSVWNAPIPLSLFANTEISVSTEGDGSEKAEARLSVKEPTGSKRSFVRFRAERDAVVLMSACPLDVGKRNGGKCMAANYMVEAEDTKKEKLEPEQGNEKKEEFKGIQAPLKGGPRKFKGANVRTRDSISPEQEKEKEKPEAEQSNEKEEFKGIQAPLKGGAGKYKGANFRVRESVSPEQENEKKKPKKLEIRGKQK